MRVPEIDGLKISHLERVVCLQENDHFLRQIENFDLLLKGSLLKIYIYLTKYQTRDLSLTNILPRRPPPATLWKIMIVLIYCIISTIGGTYPLPSFQRKLIFDTNYILSFALTSFMVFSAKAFKF